MKIRFLYKFGGKTNFYINNEKIERYDIYSDEWVNLNYGNNNFILIKLILI